MEPSHYRTDTLIKAPTLSHRFFQVRPTVPSEERVRRYLEKGAVRP